MYFSRLIYRTLCVCVYISIGDVYMLLVLQFYDIISCVFFFKKNVAFAIVAIFLCSICLVFFAKSNGTVRRSIQFSSMKNHLEHTNSPHIQIDKFIINIYESNVYMCVCASAMHVAVYNVFLCTQRPILVIVHKSILTASQ